MKATGLRKLSLLLLLGFCSHVAAKAIVEHEEPNNTAEDAYFLLVNPKDVTDLFFKFDYFGDEDWFSFYAVKGYDYAIEIPDKTVGKGINPAFEIFNTLGERETLTDLNFVGEGEEQDWTPPATGFYYVRVTNQEKVFSTDAHYSLRVYLPNLRQNVYVNGTVLDQCNQKPLKASVKTTETIDQTLTGKNGTFSIPYFPGTYTLTASTNDGVYEDQSQSFSESEQQKIVIKNLTFELARKKGCDVPLPLPPAPDPKQAVAVYDETTGELLLREIHVLNQLFRAELKDQGNYHFKLTQVTSLSSSSFTETAFFDFDSGIVDISRVYALKNFFHIKMRNVGDNTFVLEGPIVPVE